MQGTYRTKLAADGRTVLTAVTTPGGRDGWAVPVREAGVGFVGWRFFGEVGITPDAFPVSGNPDEEEN